MKAVMLSIRPKWCELIASGRKTVEVRKTRPKIPTPFKCYIYCTKFKYGEILCFPQYKTGKVIGEFVCDDIEEYLYDYCTHPEIGMDYDCGDSWWEIDKEDLERACMTYEQFKEYAMPNTDCMFGWHISDLVIYEKPRELGEFRKPLECHRGNDRDDCVGCWDCEIKRPPQSFFYVEEMV